MGPEVRCADCGKRITYKITVAGKDYCLSCAMKPEIFKKAQEQLRRERGW